MILQALVHYYEALAAQGKISKPGWGPAKISYALELDSQGNLLGVQFLKKDGEDKGKKMRPREMLLPAAVKRSSGISTNFLWDNAIYMLGIDTKGKPDRAIQCFEAAKELHLSLLGTSEEPFAKAICGFFTKWNPSAAQEHPLLADRLADFAAGENLTFMFQTAYPSENPALAAAWQAHYDNSGEGEHMRCLVTGTEVVPEATHPSLKNVRGAQAVGAALVSFNAPAFCSYNREQNLNAPVGKYASFAYTTALNHLLADADHRAFIGDTTVVYWAESAEPQFQDAFAHFFDGGSNTVQDRDLKSIMEKLASGRAADWDGLPLNPDNRFYVLGLAPNAARVSVRFFLQDTFGDMVRHLQEHYLRLEIVKPSFDREQQISLWALLQETVNQKSRNKTPAPQMAGDTLRAILTGGRYPATLYQGVQLRIRAEREISRRRAALIKAYLLRNHESYKEVLTVKLNEETTYQPYVLGRMFSVLENIQESASPGLNATITDKYLSSACATPATIFPILLDLARKHMRKLETPMRIYYAKQLGSLMELIKDSYPHHHTLYDQGIFQLGYYHQTQKRYEKKEKSEEKSEKPKEEKNS